MSTTPSNAEQRKEFVTRAVEAAVRIALISIMAMWCFQIMRPFVFLLAWGTVIAVAIHPLHVGLSARMGGRQGLSALIMTGIALLVLLLPTVLLFRSLLDGMMSIAEKVRSGALTIPPPPRRLRIDPWSAIGSTPCGPWPRTTCRT